MIKIAMYTTIITLYKQKVSQRQIAKLAKVDRKTIGKIIKRYEQEGVDGYIQGSSATIIF